MNGQFGIDSVARFSLGHHVKPAAFGNFKSTDTSRRANGGFHAQSAASPQALWRGLYRQMVPDMLQDGRADSLQIIGSEGAGIAGVV